MKALLEGGYLHGDCLTVTGKTIAENLEKVKFNTDQDVVRTTGTDHGDRRRRLAQGQPRPDGAIVKVAGLKSQRFVGPAASRQ